MAMTAAHPVKTTVSAVAHGRVSAVTLAETAIAAIRACDPALNAVSRLLDLDAIEQACQIDARIAAREDVGPVAGMPFGVKDLFDVAGLPNTAGSAMCASAPPARQGAEAARRLRAAGSVLVATLNMDKFAHARDGVSALQRIL